MKQEMKTIKIIDLAEKQLKDEILPKHIRYSDEDLYFDGVAYFDEQGNNDLLDILAMTNSALTHLNDEVEIIEEDKEMEKGLKPYKEYLEECDVAGFNPTEVRDEYIDRLSSIVIEIIDAINELKKGE